MSLLVQKKLSGTGEVWLSDINHEMLKIEMSVLKMPATILMFSHVMRSICLFLTDISMSYCVLRLKEYDAQGSGAQRNAAVLKPGGRLMFWSSQNR